MLFFELVLGEKFIHNNQRYIKIDNYPYNVVNLDNGICSAIHNAAPVEPIEVDYHDYDDLWDEDEWYEDDWEEEYWDGYENYDDGYFGPRNTSQDAY